MTEHDKDYIHPSDAEIERLMKSAAPGIETTIQTVEGAERAYFGAIMATSLPETVIASATTPSSPWTHERQQDVRWATDREQRAPH
jgi:hypothetical protein